MDMEDHGDGPEPGPGERGPSRDASRADPLEGPPPADRHAKEVRAEGEPEVGPRYHALGGTRRHSRLRALLIGFGVLLVLGGAAAGVLWQRCGLRGCPDVERLSGYMPDEASVVLDREGREIGKLFVTRRVVVPIDSIPEDVQNAFIAIEDRRFWTHGGVDWRRVLGAMWTNVKSMGIEEGSSTITMQLARNVFPDKLPASRRTIWRKLGEARVAREIEKRYDKKHILQLYLNEIYFGNGAYGIEAAAMEYFGKPASKLTLAEGATLAALPRAPSRYNPRANPEGAQEGRQLVLRRMVEQGMITAEQEQAAGKAKLTLHRTDFNTNGAAPYFVEAVRRQLEEQIGDALYTKGYRIHTTLDLAMQRTVETEIDDQLKAIESGRYGTFRHPTYASVHADSAGMEGGTPYLQVAAVFMEALSGDVVALVGGRDFDDSQYNRAVQARRQPGSAFKPFVYAAALAAGYPPTYTLQDEPIKVALDRRNSWEPRNYDGGYAGPITMRDALTRSKNVPTVRLALDVGVSRVVGMAEQLGFGSRLPTNPSVVLGTAEVSPMQLVNAYAAFATLGERPDARLVDRVEDRSGQIVWSQPPSRRHVLDPAVAFLTTDILEDVVNRGTGTAVRMVGYRGPAAGKTGTTQDAADIWFVGYTPDIVGAIWMGFDKRATVVRGATGGELAAPVWGRIMKTRPAPGHGWSPPSGVDTRVVDAFGEVVPEACEPYSETHTEYFLVGSAPLGRCSPSGYAYRDSLGYPVYTSPYDTLADRTGWWDRVRSRIFRRDSSDVRVDTLPDTLARPDSIIVPDPIVHPDSVRRDSMRRDSLRRDTLRRDTLRRDTLRRDTLRRDTLRTDTLRFDTLRRDTVSTARRPARVGRDTILVPPDTVASARTYSG